MRQLYWSVNDRTHIHSVFIDSPLARVGFSEQEVMDKKIEYQKAECMMDQIGRAKEKAETSGKIKILVDKKPRTILGCTIYGVGGDEIINMLALAIQHKLTVEQVRRTVFVHPTVSELIPWILADLK